MRRVFFIGSFLATAILVTGATSATATPASSDVRCDNDVKGIVKCTFSVCNVPIWLLSPTSIHPGRNVSPTFKSLIDYRLDFLPESNKTVEDL